MIGSQTSEEVKLEIGSAYELPEEVWVNDVNGALNYFDPMPLDGDESLQDRTENPVFTGS